MTFRILSFLSAIAPFAATCSALPPQYTVIDLGAVTSRGWDLNDHGQVIGSASIPGGGAFIWDGAMRPVRDARGYLSSGLAINEAGDMAGIATVNGAPGMYIYRQGQWVNLGTIGGAASGTVRALNNVGQAAGSAENAQGRRHAFFFDGTSSIDLGTFGGPRSEGHGLNELGDVVGSAETPNGISRAALWSEGQMINLGVGFGSSSAYDVNNSRVVVGEAITGDGFRAILWQNGSPTVLGTFGGNYSVLIDVNETGTAAGISQNPAGQNLAAIYNPSYGLVDLNTLIEDSGGLILREAWAVNEFGLVTGYAVNASGQSRAFLAFPVPAPGVSVAIALPFGAAAIRRRRHCGSTASVSVTTA